MIQVNTHEMAGALKTITIHNTERGRRYTLEYNDGRVYSNRDTDDGKYEAVRGRQHLRLVQS